MLRKVISDTTRPLSRRRNRVRQPSSFTTPFRSRNYINYLSINTLGGLGRPSTSSERERELAMTCESANRLSLFPLFSNRSHDGGDPHEIPQAFPGRPATGIGARRVANLRHHRFLVQLGNSLSQRRPERWETRACLSAVRVSYSSLSSTRIGDIGVIAGNCIFSRIASESL